MKRRRGLGSVDGRVAVVTGAASGIGRAVALTLADRGCKLGLLDRDEAALSEAAASARDRGARVRARRLDVRDAPALERFAGELAADFGAVSLLVNAAGFALLGPLMATSAEDFRALLDVNVVGTANACRAFVPHMASGGAAIVNVASAAAFATPSGLVAYGATKHAVLGLSLGLADELAAQGIGVCALCPGFVDTNIAAHAELRGENDPRTARSDAARFLRTRGLSAERVAEVAIRAAERGDDVVAVGLEAHLFEALGRWSRRAPYALMALLRAFGARQKT